MGTSRASARPSTGSKSTWSRNFPVDRAVGHATHEAKLADRAVEFVGRRLGLAQRHCGEGAETLRIDRNLIGDPRVELAGVGDTFSPGQALNAGRHGRQHLHVDAGLVHVCDAPGPQVEEFGSAPPARKEALVAGAVESLKLACREVLFQSDEKHFVIIGRGPRPGGAEQSRRQAGAEAGGAAQKPPSVHRSSLPGCRFVPDRCRIAIANAQAAVEGRFLMPENATDARRPMPCRDRLRTQHQSGTYALSSSGAKDRMGEPLPCAVCGITDAWRRRPPRYRRRETRRPLPDVRVL